MSKLNSIEITNFARFGSTPNKILIPDDEVLILGENQDSEGADSNGSGKSSFVDAIDWVINADVIRNIDTVDSVIRRGQSFCNVKLELINNNGITFLERNRDSKEKLIYKDYDSNGHLIKDYTRRLKDQTEQELFKNFNLDFKRHHFDFCNTIYFSAATVNGFASKNISNADRIALLTRFLSLDPFDTATKKAKDFLDTLKTELQAIKSKLEIVLSQLPSEYDTFKDYEIYINSSLLELNENKNEWLTYRNSLLQTENQIAIIESINAQIETIKLRQKHYEESIIRKEDLEKDLLKLKNNKTDIQDTIMQYSSIEEYNKTIEEIKKEKELQISFCGKNNEELKNILAQLKTPLICPNCNSELSYLNGKLIKVNLQELKNKQIDLYSKIDTDTTQIKELSENQKEYENTIIELNKLHNQHSSIEKSIELLTQQFNSITVNAEDFNTLISELKNKIPIINVVEIKQQIKDADEQLTFLNQEIGKLTNVKQNLTSLSEQQIDLNKKINDKNIELNKYQYWYIAFPKIKQSIIESYLPIFEDRINYYLNLINIGFKILLSTEKENKTGGFKQEFSILIEDEHGSVGKYGDYSEGERRRIAVCIGFALRDIALSHKSLPFEFTIFDEILDNLDETGVNEFFKLIQTISGQKLIISHNDSLKSLFSSIIKVTRKNGISTAQLITNN
jgi:DNA repair exonuclease SbcCD ATPase subunit